MSDFDINAMVQERDGLPTSPPAQSPAKKKRRGTKRDTAPDRPSLTGSKNKDEKVAAEFFQQDLVEEPTETAELYRKRQKRTKWMRIYIYSVMWFFFPLSVLTNIIYLGNIVGGREPVAVETTATQSPRKAMAVQEVTGYLNQDPTPMPGVQLSGWDYVEAVSDGKQAVEDAENPPEDLEEALAEAVSHETHYLSLISETGALYTAAVEIAYNDADGAWVTAPVSITGQTPPASNTNIATGDTFPNRASISGNSSHIESAVQTWSESYFSGDPVRLKQAVGDGRENTSYVPMPQAANTSVSVNAMAVGDEATYNEKQELFDIVIARVTIEVTWPSATEGISGLVNADDESQQSDDDASSEEAPAEGGHTAELSYDVLLHRADTATPQVVSWGSPGSADDLEEFSNAIAYRELSAETD